MLGKSEMMISHRDVFAAEDLKKRIFRKLERTPSLPARVAAMADGNGEMPVSQVDRQSRDSALDAGPHPQVIVSRTGDVTFANLPARALFGIGVEAIGRPVQEFELTQQPMELRAAIDEAMRERRRVTLGEQRFMPRKGDERILEVTVAPLLPDGGAAFGVSVVFEDVSRYASCAASWRATGATSSSPTRSCSRRSTSSRRPTRSSSRPTRSCRPRTRSSSRPTRSSRR